MTPPVRWIGDVTRSSLRVGTSSGPPSGELRDAGEKPTRGRIFMPCGLAEIHEEGFSLICNLLTEVAGLTKAQRSAGSGVRTGRLGSCTDPKDIMFLNSFGPWLMETSSSADARRGTVSPVFMEVSQDMSDGSNRGIVSAGLMPPTMDILTTTGERTVGDVRRGDDAPLCRPTEGIVRDGEKAVADCDIHGGDIVTAGCVRDGDMIGVVGVCAGEMMAVGDAEL